MHTNQITSDPFMDVAMTSGAKKQTQTHPHTHTQRQRMSFVLRKTVITLITFRSKVITPTVAERNKFE